MKLDLLARLALCAIASSTACIYDPAELCGPNMLQSNGVCVCAEAAITSPGGCTACAPGEVVVDDACACPPGEAKDAGGACITVPGLGTPCDDATPCSSEVFGFCWDDAGQGTCTSTCAVDTDCPESYTCADWEPAPYCRTFSGYGATCTAQEDCASFDADFCAQGHCAVHGCTVGVEDPAGPHCPRDTACCDLSAFGIGTLCIPAEFCP